METKTCSKCGRTLPVSEFGKNGKYYRSYCKECDSLYRKGRREHLNEMQRERRANDPNYHKRNKEYSKEYYLNHTAEISEKRRNARQELRTCGDNLPSGAGSRGGGVVQLKCRNCGKTFNVRTAEYDYSMKYHNHEPYYCCHECAVQSRGKTQKP